MHLFTVKLFDMSKTLFFVKSIHIVLSANRKTIVLFSCMIFDCRVFEHFELLTVISFTHTISWAQICIYLQLPLIYTEYNTIELEKSHFHNPIKLNFNLIAFAVVSHPFPPTLSSSLHLCQLIIHNYVQIVSGLR